jgi:hypothetical protein
LRIVRSVLAISIAAWLALPAFAADGGPSTEAPVDGARVQPATSYDAGLTTTGRPVSTLLPDNRDEPLGKLALLAPAALIIALTALGLTITFRSLRQDLRARRVLYRQRGRQERRLTDLYATVSGDASAAATASIARDEQTAP